VIVEDNDQVMTLVIILREERGAGVTVTYIVNLKIIN